ncbi:MAG: hypothetical protein ACD_9C00031G0003, partial [uncultured bacterium]
MDFTHYKQFKKILLLYSGGLDTSFLLRYFTRELGTEIITVSFDLGGDQREVSVVKERALTLGSSRHIHIDAKEEFVTDYCTRAIKANAIIAGAHPISSSLSRPLMAIHAISLAKQFDCDAIMHGSSGWQNNSARFDTAIRVNSSEIEIVEPVMEQNISRESEYEYLQLNGFVIDKKQDNLLSSDNNLWGREIEDGVLEHPDSEPDQQIYSLTLDPTKTPDTPIYITIDFEKGIPIAVDGRPFALFDILTLLNSVGGMHGVGRHDAMEDKIIGYKMREIHESPAATIIITAHRELENTVLPKKTLAIKSIMDREWTELACLGLWHHELREELEAFIDKASERVSGRVRVQLFKGGIH